MCDYSLEVFESVAAKVGESYPLIRFSTGTVGFCANGDHQIAACMPRGARLRVENIHPVLQEMFGLRPVEDVTVTYAYWSGHRDALRFGNGRVLSLQLIGTIPVNDVRATVLMTAAENAPEDRDLVDAESPRAAGLVESVRSFFFGAASPLVANRPVSLWPGAVTYVDRPGVFVDGQRLNESTLEAAREPLDA